MTIGQLKELLDHTIRVHGVTAEDWDINLSLGQIYGSDLKLAIRDSSAIDSADSHSGEQVLINMTDACRNYARWLSYLMTEEGIVDKADREEFESWAFQRELDEHSEGPSGGRDHGGREAVWLNVCHASSGFGNYVVPSWIRSTASLEASDLEASEVEQVRAAWLNYQSDGI